MNRHRSHEVNWATRFSIFLETKNADPSLSWPLNRKHYTYDAVLMHRERKLFYRKSRHRKLPWGKKQKQTLWEIKLRCQKLPEMQYPDSFWLSDASPKWGLEILPSLGCVRYSYILKLYYFSLIAKLTCLLPNTKNP